MLNKQCSETIFFLHQSLYALSFQSKLWFYYLMMRKEYAMSALGSKCKDVILHLWKTHKQNDLSETLQDRLKNVP